MVLDIYTEIAIAGGKGIERPLPIPDYVLY
jgi:hypothetical protein